MERARPRYWNEMSDEAFMQLANQLAALPSEYGDRRDEFRLQSFNPTPPAEDFSLFSSPVSSSNNDISVFGSIGQWPITRKNSFNDDGRYTDTPKTWPTSCDENMGSPWGQAIRFSTDSGIGIAASTMFDGRFSNSHPTMNKQVETQYLTNYDLDEWTHALKPPVPGPGYICRICHKTDHYVQNCPRAPPREGLNTPYQGHNQCYGLFECKKCNRQWGSHESYAEIGQFCRYCQGLVFPYKQYPLDKIPESKLNMLKKQYGRRRSK